MESVFQCEDRTLSAHRLRSGHTYQCYYWQVHLLQGISKNEVVRLSLTLFHQLAAVAFSIQPACRWSCSILSGLAVCLQSTTGFVVLWCFITLGWKSYGKMCRRTRMVVNLGQLAKQMSRKTLHSGHLWTSACLPQAQCTSSWILLFPMLFSPSFSPPLSLSSTLSCYLFHWPPPPPLFSLSQSSLLFILFVSLEPILDMNPSFLLLQISPWNLSSRKS